MHARSLLVLTLLLGCDREHKVNHGSETEEDAGSDDEVSEDATKFSFFVTSLQSLQELSGSQTGFGGDLRFGETGEGAGLRGADKICAAIAELSLPGSKDKGWRAFLSTSSVDARDRIGEGPWYDRKGRIVAEDLESLLTERPAAAAEIMNDLPNEFGVPNHDPDGKGQVDNHDMLTGSNSMGRLYCPDDAAHCTCDDWTSSEPTGRPRVGHSWPRSGTPVGAGGFGGIDLGALLDGGLFPAGGGGLFGGAFAAPDGGRPTFGGFPFPGLGGDGGVPFMGGFPGFGGDGGFSLPGLGGDGSINHWISALDEAGCAPGVSLIEMGPPQLNNPTVGSGGGYGGFYCFALEP
jgi:hypothetical protein